MNATQKDNLNLELEKFVDTYGLKNVIDALSEVCQDKAVHIAENWHDTKLAKIWHQRGNSLSTFSATFTDPDSGMRQVVVDYHKADDGE